MRKRKLRQITQQDRSECRGLWRTNESFHQAGFGGIGKIAVEALIRTEISGILPRQNRACELRALRRRLVCIPGWKLRRIGTVCGDPNGMTRSDVLLKCLPRWRVIPRSINSGQDRESARCFLLAIRGESLRPASIVGRRQRRIRRRTALDVEKHQKFLSNASQIISTKSFNQIVDIPSRVGSPLLLASGNAPGLLSNRQELDVVLAERPIFIDMGVFIGRGVARTAKIPTPKLWRGADELCRFFNEGARDLVCAIGAWNSLAHCKSHRCARQIRSAHQIIPTAPCLA